MTDAWKVRTRGFELGSGGDFCGRARLSFGLNLGFGGEGRRLFGSGASLRASAGMSRFPVANRRL
jgi:hypothetical protein